MNSPYIQERRRIMGPDKKAKFCRLIRESQTIEHAAEWLDVSIRTVQRERKRDEDFDHEVRLALQATPDPLTLMENAARTHWRAAAWLLERTRPEQFARKPANTARDYQVEAALAMLLEAALAATAPAERAKFYQQVQPVCGQALQYCFPQLGPNGNLKKSKLPPTPLADDESRAALQQIITASMAQAAAAAQLSPETHDTTASDATTTGATTQNVPIFRSPIPDPRSPLLQLSPKTREATPSDATPSEELVLSFDDNLPIDFNLPYDDFAQAIAARDPNEQAVLWDQRLRHRGAAKRRKERQAVKRQQRAKKRAAANRRRNAA